MGSFVPSLAEHLENNITAQRKADQVDLGLRIATGSRFDDRR
jgi:hypothetical protein